MASNTYPPVAAGSGTSSQGIEHPRWVGEVGGMAFLIAGDKRSGRQSGRGRRRKQTCVCVKPVSSERANKEIFCQVTSETARVEKKRSLVVKGVAIGEAGGHEGKYTFRY
ncbi:hypothetical protein GQR58_007759 [Nymphon striatum]|nr:hypothetical protein GQR58_007759 [Nymphon striatum]